jgi:hypothetical protein
LSGGDLTRYAERGSAKVDAAAQSELNDLLFRWSEVYDIRYDEASRTWLARYKTATDELAGRSCGELREAIRADYPERRLAEQRVLARLHERSST